MKITDNKYIFRQKVGTTEAMKQEQELQKKQDYKENQYLNSRMNIIIKETPYKIG